MKSFRLNENTEIICEWKKTRNGFKHEATLMVNGSEVEKVKCCYINRTWESFEYETVIDNLLSKTKRFTDEEKEQFMNIISGRSSEDINNQFRMIANISRMGELICQTKKEKNDWKERMIRAGLEDKGLIMPEDWDSLSEDDKESRLNMIISHLNK